MARPFKFTIEYGARFDPTLCLIVPMTKRFTDPKSADKQVSIWTAMARLQGYEVYEAQPTGNKCRTVLAYDYSTCPLSPALIISIEMSNRGL